MARKIKVAIRIIAATWAIAKEAVIKANSKIPVQAGPKAALNPEWEDLEMAVQVETLLHPGTPATATADGWRSFAHYEIPYSSKQNESIKVYGCEEK